MLIELKCVEEGHTDKRWMLDLNGPIALLKTLAGEVVTKFTSSEANQRFRLPGLAEGARHFSITLDEQTVRFAVDPLGLQHIETFLNRAFQRPNEVVSASAPSSAASRPNAPITMRVTQFNPFAAAIESAESDVSSHIGFGTRFINLVISSAALTHTWFQIMQLMAVMRVEGWTYKTAWTPALGVFVGGVLGLVCLVGALRRKKKDELRVG